jgi:hypothetical protein
MEWTPPEREPLEPVAPPAKTARAEALELALPLTRDRTATLRIPRDYAETDLLVIEAAVKMLRASLPVT